MIDRQIGEQMQRDWNERAREDANFYVAFGRREQEEAEFLATAADVVRSLEAELKRFPRDGNPRARRALEIGCGPGRLLRPMSRHFGEIHGVDVSDEMINRARNSLAGIPHAHAHHTSGADLAAFADESFDFVYSYAVFQHIPSRDVVFEYLREAHRVLKTGGILWVQINGREQDPGPPDTWQGVRISAGDVAAFAHEHDFQVLALEGERTQYMWTTWRKQQPGWRMGRPLENTRIRRITNAHSSEPVAPARGRFAAVSLWVENLPATCDLLSLKALVGGSEAAPCYVGPPDDKLTQLNLRLPDLKSTGLLPVEIFSNGKPLCPRGWIRVISPGPQVPRLISVTDGINLLSTARIDSGVVKVTMEEVEHPELFAARIGGLPVGTIESLQTEPYSLRYEFNFRVPQQVAPGSHLVEIELGRRRFGPVGVEVVRETRL